MWFQKFLGITFRGSSPKKVLGCPHNLERERGGSSSKKTLGSTLNLEREGGGVALKRPLAAH